MRRNDLTPDEARMGRLIQSLDQGSPAPDAEFLRRLRETTTAAFLEAHRARSLQIELAARAGNGQSEAAKPFVEVSAATPSAPSALPAPAVTPVVAACNVESPQLSLPHVYALHVDASQSNTSQLDAYQHEVATVSTESSRDVIPARVLMIRQKSGRLHRLRIAMLVATAALLVFGFLPDSLVPSRGVRLKVAFDNLARASSAEFEVHNGDSSSLMLVAQDNNKLYWNVLYPSGNAEVSDGVNAYFFNAKSNSLHFVANEDSAGSPRPDEKLLGLVNVVDDSVRFPLEQQRPQAIIEDHGQSLFVYNYSKPSFNDNGTISVEARVDARTNELVALNSVCYDDTGRVNFQAGVNVRSLNRSVANEGFRLVPESINADVAMVEEVQGNPTVDPPLQLAASQNSFVGNPNAADYVELPADGLGMKWLDAAGQNSGGMNYGNNAFSRAGGGLTRQLNRNFGMTDQGLNSQSNQFGDQAAGLNAQRFDSGKDGSQPDSKQVDSPALAKQGDVQDLSDDGPKSTMAAMVPSRNAIAPATPPSSPAASAAPAGVPPLKQQMAVKREQGPRGELQQSIKTEQMPAELKSQVGLKNRDGVPVATKEVASEAEVLGVQQKKRQGLDEPAVEGADDQKQVAAVEQKMATPLVLKGRAFKTSQVAGDADLVEKKKSESISKQDVQADQTPSDAKAAPAKAMVAEGSSKIQAHQKPDQRNPATGDPQASFSEKAPGTRAVAQSPAKRLDSPSMPLPAVALAESQIQERSLKPQAKMSIGPGARRNQTGLQKEGPGEQESMGRPAVSGSGTNGVVANDKMPKDRASNVSEPMTDALPAASEAAGGKSGAGKADIVKAENLRDGASEKMAKAKVVQGQPAMNANVENSPSQQPAVEKTITQEAAQAAGKTDSISQSDGEKSSPKQFSKPTRKAPASDFSEAQVAEADSGPGTVAATPLFVAPSDATSDETPALPAMAHSRGVPERSGTQATELYDQPRAGRGGGYGDNRVKNPANLRGFSHLWYANPKKSKALSDQNQIANESIAANPGPSASSDNPLRATWSMAPGALNNGSQSSSNPTLLRGNSAGAMGGYGGIVLDNSSVNSNRSNPSGMISNGISGNGIISNGMNSAGAIHYRRRQAEPQTELLAGEVLSTLNDGGSLVRARLANNSELVLGPNSEVTLIKPTAVQLKVGELELNVPEGDQIELLGPMNDVKVTDSRLPEEANADVYYSRQNRSDSGRSSRARTSTPPQIVTGRKMYRIENNQLRVVEQNPQWLTDYHRERMNLQSKGAMPAAKMAPVEAAEPDAAQPAKGGPPQ